MPKALTSFWLRERSRPVFVNLRHAWIVDFAVGVDKIVLENAVMPGLGLGVGPLLQSQFALVGEVLAPLDRIIFDATTGELFYDSNGSAAGGSALLATFAFPSLADIEVPGGLKASGFLII